MVTVLEFALVMRMAACALEGGTPSDQLGPSCHPPPAALIQLLDAAGLFATTMSLACVLVDAPAGPLTINVTVLVPAAL